MNTNDDRTRRLGKLPVALPSNRVSLLFYHHEGVRAVPLSAGEPVVVGRAGPSDVVVSHPGLSRRHARFELQDEQVWLEDLGSTNGTRVNGEQVERAQVVPGDEIRVGEVVVSVHARPGLLSGLEGERAFRARLEEEVERARFYERRLALLAVQPGATQRPLREQYPALQALQRQVDRLALLAPDTLGVLQQETTADQALRLAHQVATGEGRDLRCGVALYPDDCTSAAKLARVALVAADRADTNAPVCSAGTQQDPGAWAPASAPASPGEGEPVVCSEAMERVYDMARQVAGVTLPVLILGETGSGKELVARAVHNHGADRRPGPMRNINCAAIPDQLIESALFGHERGAFTGAVSRSKGVFEEADRGTVFLDEVGELSPGAQAALLRVLESGTISRVGSTREVTVDVRVVAATHRDLEAMCQQGTFRFDLLYRLNAMTIKLPPLRRRPEEIQPLADHFLARAARANGLPAGDISAEVLELFLAHRWPGNVRELRNEVERALVLARGRSIDPEHLSDRLRAVPAAEPDPVDAAPGEDRGEDFKTRVQRFEVRLILGALDRAGWNKAAAARLLGIPRRTLNYKIKSYDLVQRGG